MQLLSTPSVDIGFIRNCSARLAAHTRHDTDHIDQGMHVHNASDCCCVNLLPRSAVNLASTVVECAEQCRNNAGRWVR